MQNIHITKKFSSKKRYLLVCVAICLWFLWWFLSQALFIINVPILTDLLTGGVTPAQSFINITLFLLVPTFFAFLVFHKFVNDYRFLRTNRYVLLLYIIPLILFMRLLTVGDIYGVPAFVYGLGMIISAAVQDIGTFGFLQTFVEKHIPRILAAIVVAIAFFIAHFQYGMAYEELFYFSGFLLFALLRYKTKSIYVTNVLHLSFLLLV